MTKPGHIRTGLIQWVINILPPEQLSYMSCRYLHIRAKLCWWYVNSIYVRVLLPFLLHLYFCHILCLASCAAIIAYPAPLPTFSTMLQEFMASDDLHKENNWRQFILESSFYYYALVPRQDGPARISYMNIGRTMYEKYPKISAKGSTPWVQFSCCNLP